MKFLRPDCYRDGPSPQVVHLKMVLHNNYAFVTFLCGQKSNQKSPPRIENFNWSSRAGSPFIADQFEIFTHAWTQRAGLAFNYCCAMVMVKGFFYSFLGR